MSARRVGLGALAVACVALSSLAIAGRAQAGSAEADFAALDSPHADRAGVVRSATPAPRISLVPGVASALRGAIVLYQVTLSSQDAPVCNYEPTCSHFAQQALRLRGPLIGTLLASDRLQRCLGAARSHYPIDPVTTRALDPVPVAAPHR